jgi:ATP-dependent DNA ligase
VAPVLRRSSPAGRGLSEPRSCLIDGEAIAVEADGLASFDTLRGRRHDRQVTLCAFDLLELDGRGLRRRG